eukprot:TRINITY_DN2492_c0_g1_i1.p1 TRINITY_DN2492_c0_g1~~TRINITY_DN2492_c0_g1_i1.p1  ORF type:complete len:357 (-),score=102.71 TRINITY_DN2492_c0_g1_i1:17-1087(-)
MRIFSSFFQIFSSFFCLFSRFFSFFLLLFAEKPCHRCKIKKIECTETIVKRKSNKIRKTGHVYPDPAFRADGLNFLPPNYFMNPLVSLGNSFHSSPYDGINLQPDLSSNPYDWNLDPLGLSNMMNSPSESAPRPIDDPPSFNTWNPNLMQQVIEKVTKLGLDPAFIEKIWHADIDKVEGLKKFITPDQKILLRNNFEKELAALRGSAEYIEFPVIIWERLGVINYVNSAFRQITGFDAPVPTSPEDHAIFQVISTQTLLQQVRSVLPRLVSGNEKRITCEASFKRYGTAEEEYVSGLAAISVKRDLFGLPHIFYCQFIPTENTSEDLPENGNNQQETKEGQSFLNDIIGMPEIPVD